MRKRTLLLFAIGAIAALVVGWQMAAFASHPEVSLSGSNFEIDTNANLKQDDPSPSIDWASVAENRKADAPSGAADDSFGNGTKEDTAVPSVVSGSIPPNKSDLLNFGVYLETVGNQRFLNLFWHRVQEPSGTTNMDFELNQSSSLSGNGVTPVRTAGDLLIQYDLAQGGTNPQLFVSRWVTTGNPAQVCQASNSLPCWGTRVNLSAAGNATGSINTSPIPAAEADGLGAVSARTFGEAQIDFNALAGGPGQCTSFGSAYLKSRSSDSFTAALKDFIAPTPVSLNNCATVIIRKETNPEENPNSTNFGFTKSFPTQPSSANTFTLQDDGNKTYSNVVQGTGYSVDEDVIPNGWDLTNIDCSVAGHPSVSVPHTINVANGTVTFDIDSPSDVLDCTYTNTKRGHIIVDKVTNPSGDPQSFDFTLTGGPSNLNDAFSLTDAATPHDSGAIKPGSGYNVAETVPTGWDLTSATCDDGSSITNIDVSAGETVTCTYTNTKRGHIVVDKVTDPSGDPQSFDFTLTGGPSNLNQAFSLTDADTPHDSGAIKPGSGYDASEVNIPTGWDLISATCDKGESDVHNITVEPGETVTCTFTNRVRGIISIHKEDDAGNPLEGAVFTLYHNNPPLDAPRGDAAEDPAVDPAVTCTTDANGDCLMPDLVPGEYWVVETTTPAGHNTADDQRATITPQNRTISLTFEDPRRFDVIVLVCRESDNSLYSSNVTIDGEDKSSLGSAVNESDLCSLGGARYEGKLTGDHPGNVNIPVSELP